MTMGAGQTYVAVPEGYNNAVMAVLSLVFGADLIAKGLPPIT